MYPFSHSPCSLNRTLGYKFVAGRLLRTGSSHNNDVLVLLHVTPQRRIVEAFKWSFSVLERMHLRVCYFCVHYFFCYNNDATIWCLLNVCYSWSLAMNCGGIMCRIKMHSFSCSPCSFDRIFGCNFCWLKLPRRSWISHNNNIVVLIHVTPEMDCAGIEVELSYTRQCTPGCILPLSESLEWTQ
jgi:hypothetical protein